MRVRVDIGYADLDGDYGEVEGICASCSKCGHEVEVFGTSEASAKRACVMMRDECPQGESNFYFTEYEG